MSNDSSGITVFLAGIIQGSLPDGVCDQGYRSPIKSAIAHALPDAELFDPVEHYPDSLSYDTETGAAAFFDLMERAGKTDLLVAFVPEASMGTAIEIWKAYHAGSAIVVIGPLRENWVVRFMADHICDSIDDFLAFARDSGLRRLVEEKAQMSAEDGR